MVPISFPPPVPAPAPVLVAVSGLAQRLRVETAALHREAEQSEVIVALISGRLSRATYCVLLRNLHALYQALETAVTAAGNRGECGPVSALIAPALCRSEPLADDLVVLHGPGWQADLPVTTAMQTHVDRIARLAASQPLLLAAPAYVRYLGDLNGGRLLEAAVVRAFGLQAGGAGARFYDFGGLARGAKLARDFRLRLDSLITDAGLAPDSAAGIRLADQIVQEAQWSFRAHVQLFEELRVSAPG